MRLSGSMGLGDPPDAESNPFLLKISFTVGLDEGKADFHQPVLPGVQAVDRK
jgi:hypothetical protein